MIHGLDTTLLVQIEVAGHPGHAAARRLLDRLLDTGDTFALAPQVLTELVHVVTDPKRFERPLSMQAALQRAEQWWQAREVVPVFPDDRTVPCFLRWLQQHHLGRKRLLDTFLAATYFTNDIGSVLTTNARDFQAFDCFSIVAP